MAKKNNESPSAPEKSTIEINDSFITAVFAEKNYHFPNNKPFDIQPFLKTPSEVAWRVTGNGIMQVLEEIYADTPVPVNSYIKALKEIRSSIFLFKQLGRPKQKQGGM